MRLQEWEEKVFNALCGCWINLESNNAWIFFFNELIAGSGLQPEPKRFYSICKIEPAIKKVYYLGGMDKLVCPCNLRNMLISRTNKICPCHPGKRGGDVHSGNCALYFV